MNILNKISCSLLLTLIGAAGVAGEAYAQSAVEISRGHELFINRGCYLCHGTVGQGGIAGPHLVPDTLPAEAFLAFVRRPPSEMPPFSEKIMSDAELHAVHAYLSSLPKSPTADSIKLLPKPVGK